MHGQIVLSVPSEVAEDTSRIHANVASRLWHVLDWQARSPTVPVRCRLQTNLIGTAHRHKLTSQVALFRTPGGETGGFNQKIQ